MDTDEDVEKLEEESDDEVEALDDVDTDDDVEVLVEIPEELATK